MFHFKKSTTVTKPNEENVLIELYIVHRITPINPVKRKPLLIVVRVKD